MTPVGNCLNRRVRDAHGLLATRESAYNKAREHAAAAKERLPALQSQADEAARKAKMSALAAQEHAGGAAACAFLLCIPTCSPCTLQWCMSRGVHAPDRVRTVVCLSCPVPCNTSWHACAASERSASSSRQSTCDEAALLGPAAFEKLKKEAEAEDAQKAALWADVRSHTFGFLRHDMHACSAGSLQRMSACLSTGMPLTTVTQCAQKHRNRWRAHAAQLCSEAWRRGLWWECRCRRRAT